jgi:hypothetical protein
MRRRGSALFDRSAPPLIALPVLRSSCGGWTGHFSPCCDGEKDAATDGFANRQSCRKCAVIAASPLLPVLGAENVEPAIEFLYRDWLPASGEDLRDFPLYCQRVSFVPMVLEYEAITDIFLPLV